MSDLTEFIMARIAEDECRAKRAAFGWGAEWFGEDAGDEWYAIQTDGKRDMVACEDRDVIAHIATHDPARALAECEVKRQLVSWFGGYWLRILALPYANHPDYRQEWKP